MCNIAHHADVGGAVPGSMAGGMTEIYQEGSAHPRRAAVQQSGESCSDDLMDLILLNVRVIPTERQRRLFRPDCRLPAGHPSRPERDHRRSLRRTGHAAWTCFDQIVGRTAKRMRDRHQGALPDGDLCVSKTSWMTTGWATSRYPDQGRDHDQAGSRYPFRFLRHRAAGATATSTSPTTPPKRAVCYALKALLDPDVPNNQGVLDIAAASTRRERIAARMPPFQHPLRQGPIPASASSTSSIGALAEGQVRRPRLPQPTARTPRPCSPERRSAHRAWQYVYLETLGGGFGGRATKDGKDGVQVHITNTSNLPVEAIEMEYPVDGPSPTRWSRIPAVPASIRGGLGLRKG